MILTHAILLAFTDNNPDTSKVEFNLVAPKTFNVELHVAALAAIKLLLMVVVVGVMFIFVPYDNIPKLIFVVFVVIPKSPVC